MKSDWELGSAEGGGSSFKSMERCVARLVAGLGADMAESELEDVGEGLGSVFVGSSRRKGGSGLFWAMGELRTASRTGSKAGMVEQRAESKMERRILGGGSSLTHGRHRLLQTSLAVESRNRRGRLSPSQNICRRGAFSLSLNHHHKVQ